MQRDAAGATAVAQPTLGLRIRGGLAREDREGGDGTARSPHGGAGFGKLFAQAAAELQPGHADQPPHQTCGGVSPSA